MDVSEAVRESATQLAGVDPKANEGVKSNAVDYWSYGKSYRSYDTRPNPRYYAKTSLILDPGPPDYLEDLMIRFRIAYAQYDTLSAALNAASCGYRSIWDFLISLTIRSGSNEFRYDNETLMIDIKKNWGFIDPIQKAWLTNSGARTGLATGVQAGNPPRNSAVEAANINCARNGMAFIAGGYVDLYLPLPFFARRFMPCSLENKSTQTFIDLQLRPPKEVVEGSYIVDTNVVTVSPVAGDILDISLVAMVSEWDPATIAAKVGPMRSPKGMEVPVELPVRFTPTPALITNTDVVNNSLTLLMGADGGMYSEIFVYFRSVWASGPMYTTGDALTTANGTYKHAANSEAFIDIHSRKPTGMTPTMTIAGFGQSSLITRETYPLEKCLWDETTKAQSQGELKVTGAPYSIAVANPPTITSYNAETMASNFGITPIYRWSMCEWEQLSHDSGEFTGHKQLGPRTQIIFQGILPDNFAGRGGVIPVIIGYKRGSTRHKPSAFFLDWEVPKGMQY